VSLGKHNMTCIQVHYTVTGYWFCLPNNYSICVIVLHLTFNINLFKS